MYSGLSARRGAAASVSDRAHRCGGIRLKAHFRAPRLEFAHRAKLVFGRKIRFTLVLAAEPRFDGMIFMATQNVSNHHRRAQMPDLPLRANGQGHHRRKAVNVEFLRRRRRYFAASAGTLPRDKAKCPLCNRQTARSTR